MKQLMVFALMLVAGVAGAQITPSAEQLLTPDSVLILQDGEYSRTLTGESLKQEFNRYEADMKATQGAYEEVVEPGKVNVVIPMAPEARLALEKQQELFRQSTLNFVDTLDIPRAAVQSHEFQTGYNRQWGQKDKFAAYIDALLRIYGSQEYRSLDAHCNAGGYVFNYEAKALEFSMAMRNGTQPSGHTVLKVFGQTKFSSSGTSLYKKVFFQGEVSKTVRFFIGPVPVSVQGAIGGSAGFDAGVSVVGTGIQGSLTPYITSYGKADAGVDLWFVKAGVEGTLDLINDNLPATLTVQLLPDNKTLELALKVTNNLKALAGKIVVFVKVKEFWKFWTDSWKKYSTTLFSWDGYQNSWILFEKSAKIPLN